MITITAACRAMRLCVWLLAALGMVIASRTSAQEQVDDYDPFHWGYAPMFGGGTYRLSDRTEARIVRISPSIKLREPAVRRGPNFGVRLLLPFSVGVQNLSEEELPAGRPDDEIEHAAIVPGLEFEFPGERFAVRVRGQAGWGKELEGNEMAARLYALGIRSRFGWPDVIGSPTLISGLLWAGFDPDEGEARSLLQWTQGLEFDVPVPRWEFNNGTMHLMPHVLGHWYYRPPPELAFGDDDFDHVEAEWQLGLAARRAGGFKIWFVEFEAVGIAYRFSEHRAGIRFFLNSIF